MHSETTDGQDVRQQVEQTASTVVEQARQVAETRVSTQKERAAETLGTVAQTLRDSSSSLREQQPQIASLADEAAARVEGLSTYVRDHELGDFISEAESFARRQPVVFLGGAFAVGFLAARFLKATSDSRSGSGAWPSGRSAQSYAAGNFGSAGYGAGSSAFAGARATDVGAGLGSGLSSGLDEGSVYGRSGGYGESGYAGSTAGTSSDWTGDASATRETEYVGAAYMSAETGQDAESAAGSGVVTDELGTTDATLDESRSWDRAESDR